MFIAFLISIVLAVICIIVGNKYPTIKSISYIVALFAIIVIVVAGGFSLVIYTSGVDDYGLLLTQEKVLQAGMIAIEATDKTMIKESYNTDSKSIIGGIENIKQSSNTSERIKEYRDTIVVYEQLIGKYRAYCSIWWYKNMLPGCLVDYIESLEK